jgi:hypothetical protein
MTNVLRARMLGAIRPHKRVAVTARRMKPKALSSLARGGDRTAATSAHDGWRLLLRRHGLVNGLVVNVHGFGLGSTGTGTASPRNTNSIRLQSSRATREKEKNE